MVHSGNWWVSKLLSCCLALCAQPWKSYSSDHACIVFVSILHEEQIHLIHCTLARSCRVICNRSSPVAYCVYLHCSYTPNSILFQAQATRNRMRAIIRPCRTPKRRAARVDIRRFHNCKWTIIPTNRSRCYVGLLHDGQFLTQKRGAIGEVSLDVEILGVQLPSTCIRRPRQELGFNPLLSWLMRSPG